MVNSIEDKFNQYMSIFNSLYKKYKWQAQSQILTLIPLIYMANDKVFDLKEYDELCYYIKKNSGVFSPLHSYQRFPTAAVLIAKYSNPKEKFQQLSEFQKALLRAGFKESPHLIISALSLMATVSDSTLESRLDRAMELYKGMRSKHFFLTSQSDYPLAILLSNYHDPVDEIIEGMEYYYEYLAMEKFKKGNDLQFLSHILMLSNTENKNFMIDRCNDLYTELSENGLKIKRLHYPQIGIMAIVDSDLDDEIEHIKIMTGLLNNEKKLRHLKDINLIVAIIITITNLLKKVHPDINIIEAGLSTSIEAIIEAQNAALIAFLASTSAATINITGS